MKYILVGGSGFIGKHFQNVLKSDVILNIDINSGVFNSKFTKGDILDDRFFNEIDINTNEDITLIHLAAVHFDFQKQFFQTNVEGTKNVLRFVKSCANIKNYVFFSSVATYGNSEDGKSEKSIQDPINDYGKSKLEAEKLILDWHKVNHNRKVIIIRPAVVFGEFNFGNVYNLIQQIKTGFFAIIGDGKNIKSIAYAKNVVDSVIFCLENINEKLFIYNYCDYPQMSIESQSNLISNSLSKNKPFKIPLMLTKLFTLPIDILEKIIGVDLKINSMRVKKFTTSTFFISNKLRELGFVQRFSIKEAINNTNEWICSVNISDLRNKWFKNASRL